MGLQQVTVSICMNNVVEIYYFHSIKCNLLRYTKATWQWPTFSADVHLELNSNAVSKVKRASGLEREVSEARKILLDELRYWHTTLLNNATGAICSQWNNSNISCHALISTLQTSHQHSLTTD